MQMSVTLQGNNGEEFARLQELLDELEINEGDQPDYSQVDHLSKALEDYLEQLSKEDIY